MYSYNDATTEEIVETLKKLKDAFKIKEIFCKQKKSNFLIKRK